MNIEIQKSIEALIAKIGQENVIKHIESLNLIYNVEGEDYLEKESRFCDIVIKKTFEIFNITYLDPSESPRRCVNDTERSNAYCIICYLLIEYFKIPIQIVMQKLKKTNATILKYRKRYYSLDRKIPHNARVLDIADIMIKQLSHI